MICLTRLHGDQFFLNEDLIERVDQRIGGTAIFTVGGNVYAVKETADEVAEVVREEKAAIIRASNRLERPRPHLSLIGNSDVAPR